MAARWYLTKDEMYLQTKYIPTLAATIFTPNAGKKLQKGVRPLPGKKKFLTLSYDTDKLLVLAGTTAELKEFRAGLNADKVDAIGLEDTKEDPLVTWCTRVDVNHPEKPAEGNTTVTLVLIGLKDFFTKNKVDPAPKAPWKPFPHARDNLTPTGGFVHLDMGFDKALDYAQKHPKAN